MITISTESALTSILLVVSIVAVIFIIVLLARVIKMLDKVNDMVDEGMYTVHDVKKVVGEKLGGVKEKTNKVSSLAHKGADDARALINKIPFVR